MYTKFMDDKKEKELKQKEKDLDKREIKLEKEEKKHEKKLSKKLSDDSKAVRKEFLDNTIKLMISAFGLVAALAWNDFIKEFVKTNIEPLFGENSGLIAMFTYALLVTALAVLATYLLSKMSGREKK